MENFFIWRQPAENLQARLNNPRTEAEKARG